MDGEGACDAARSSIAVAEVGMVGAGVMKIPYYLLIYHQRSGMVSVPFKG